MFENAVNWRVLLGMLSFVSTFILARVKNFLPLQPQKNLKAQIDKKNQGSDPQGFNEDPDPAFFLLQIQIRIRICE